MFLLDVNVLIALLWEPHVHHAAAQQWFATHGKKGWSTCATTELGFARALSNPKINPAIPSPVEAIAFLDSNKKVSRHAFVNEDVTPAAATKDMLIQGYRQLTNAYLFGLCVKKRLIFVSFDTGLASLWRPGDPRVRFLKLLDSAPLH